MVLLESLKDLERSVGLATTRWDTVSGLSRDLTTPCKSDIDTPLADFSGHIDSHTEQGWSNQIARIYLNSLLTFDLTSYTYRNISTVRCRFNYPLQSLILAI